MKRICVVCGEVTRSANANPGWIMSLIAGARVHDFTLKAPGGNAVHDKCRDALCVLMDRKKLANKRELNENLNL
jgi:hypothetical protein